ncbi:MAG: Rrf2 family transcriptional regulator [Patescibacteria group bacterium]|jgi:Rrf2 family protein
MLFTTKTEYGLKALVILAENQAQRPISLAEIARVTGLSLSYLEQLFAKLKQAKLVKSIKGAEGGYALSRSAGRINLLEIVEALEGSVAVNQCMSSNCSTKNCLTRRVWLQVQGDVIKTLKKYKLSNLI